jgi:RNA polymerase sigma factor (sigma-70 family)
MSKSLPLEETQFIEGIRTNDHAIIKAVYRTHYPPIRSYVLKNHGTEDDARDIYQECMTILCRNLQQEPDFQLSCSISTFLYAVARNLWLKSLRDNSRTGVLVHDNDGEEDADTGVHWEKEQQINLMLQSMEDLGEPCKTLLNDFYVHRLSMESISDKFGYTNADNAKNQKYKCLQRLKKLFFTQYKGNK